MKKLLPFLLVFLCCVVVCCVLVVGALALGVFAAKPDYTFSQEQMSATYLKSVNTLGEYKRVDTGGVDLSFGDKFSIATFSKTGKLATEFQEGVVTVMVGTGGDEFRRQSNELSDIPGTESETGKETCDPYEARTGQTGTMNFIKYLCNNVATYMFNDADAWIIVSTGDGNDGLKAAINGYKGQ